MTQYGFYMQISQPRYELPTISSLNDRRRNHFTTYRDETTSTDQKIKNWIAHKFYSVILLPANCSALYVNLGLLLSAYAIAAFKIAVYAVSLTNIRLKIPTGAVWLHSRMVGHLEQIILIIGETVTDIAFFNICDKVISISSDILSYIPEAIYERV